MASSSPTSVMQVDPDGVAVITLQNAPVNALHPDVLRALFESAQRAHQDPRVKAIVVVGSGGAFSAGFDINMFREAGGGGGVDGRINDAICAALESGPKPTVAAVRGVALGGGLEVAMGCNARVAAPGAKLGLPELTLGVLPGFGGTQRLPRLVGLKKGVEMMLTSAPIKAEQGLKLGLVDAVVPDDQLMAAAKQTALDIAAGRRARMSSLTRTDRLEPLGEALQILDFARDQASKRARNLQHPLLCLDAIREGVANGGAAGLKRETEAFAAAASMDAHKSLVHVFFASRATKKVRGVTDAGLTPRPMRTVAVLGGGLMGSGIATALALNGVDVILKEVSQQFLDAGLARVKANVASRVKKGRMTQPAADAVVARVKGALDYSSFKSADMVIEAVIEDVALKQRIFADLEAACRPDCVLATNTSTIDISLVGAKCSPSAASRVVGAHFFSPAHVMPLLEIVRTDKTSKQVVLDTLALGARIKKTPVVVGNCTGFAVNRVFFPYTMAAVLLADCGVNPYEVDKIIAGFGMPMGPFRLNDLVGSDIGLHVGKNFVEAFAERVYASHLIPLLNEHKRLGEKTGKGFYKYDDRRRASPDPEIRPLIERSAAESGVLQKVFGGKPPKMTPQEVVEFIFFPVVNEGCRVVGEGVVEKPADLDVATVMAMGFPPYRGGLIFWADLVGAKRIVDALDALAAKFEPAGVSGFFKPCDYLRSAAQSGRKLSAGVVASRL